MNPYTAMGVPAHIGPYEALVVGASFGGPPAIEALLTSLPADFPVPVLVCQHIMEGFTGGWAERLCRRSRIKVVEAKPGVPFCPGTAYIAPSGFQTRFSRATQRAILRIERDFADSLYVPSVDITMSSAAQVFGSHTLAVLLTGLGNDGACGMLAVRQAGGYTIAESAESAASYSMPESAGLAGAVVEELPLDGIIARIAELVAGGRSRGRATTSDR